MTTTELFKRDGASAGALKLIGGGGSALQSVWHAAILKLRGVPLYPAEGTASSAATRNCPTRSPSGWARA